MGNAPRDRPSPAPDDADRESTRKDALHRDTRTESQSAYLREQHRGDAAPGDASADVEEVRRQGPSPGSGTTGGSDSAGRSGGP